MALVIHFIRHAESESNVQTNRVGGQQNHVPLTPKGEAQANQLQRFLEQTNLHVHHIISSPAIRAHTTARLATKHLNKEIELDARIVEYSYGEWEGRLKEEVLNKENQHAWRSNLDFKAPGGETVHELIQRNKQALHEHTKKHYQEGEQKHILWFSHGRAIRSLIADLLGNRELTFRASKENTARSVLVYDGEHWHLHRYNDTKHLHAQTKKIL